MSAFAGRFLLGANYWSRAGGPRMWERFDEARVAAELRQMRAIGLDCARLFAFVPSFCPRPPAVDGAMLARFRRVLELCGEAGIGALPTALVGHMSGENFDFPAQNGRPLYRDPELLAWQRALALALADAGRDLTSPLGWVLSNEMPLWAGAGGDDAVGWCRALVDAIRARSPLPVGTGDGAMASFPVRATAPQVDWLGPHVYYADLDPLRQALHTDFTLRALQPLGRPLVLEEFGCSSAQAGEREQAAYFRDAIFAALSLGARGAIGWCFSDFDPETLGRETPYSHHPFELGFGLTRADGSEKPVCDELRAIRRLVDALPLAELRPVAPRAAILRPRYLDEEFPFSWQDRDAGRAALEQAYVLAVQAGLDPAVVGELDDLSPYALILCPSTQKLTTPTWLALRDRARAGATVYWSYCGGDHSFHQGAWCPIFEELTGLRHRLRYGCFDPPDDLLMLRALGLAVPSGGGAYARMRLPVELRQGAPVEVLATDGRGRPALTAHDLGAGRFIFLTHPIERYLAALADGSSREGHRLYARLADEAGLEPAYPTRHPDVHARVLACGRDDLVIVQHRGWTASVDDATGLERKAELLFESGAHAGGFGPKGVRVWRLRDAR